MSNRLTIITEIITVATVLHRLIQMQLRTSLKDAGLSGAQVHVLLAIGHHQPISSTQLAGLLQLTPGAISQSLEALSSGKLITRTAEANDRRVEMIALTKRGEAKMELFNKARNKVLGNALTSLSDEELNHYLEIQRKMSAALSGAAQEAPHGTH